MNNEAKLAMDAKSPALPIQLLRARVANAVQPATEPVTTCATVKREPFWSRFGDLKHEFDEVKANLELLKHAVQQINELRMKDQNAVHEQERKIISADLDRIVSAAPGIAAAIKRSLDQIKGRNDEFAATGDNRHSATNQMRTNLHQSHVRRFVAVMSDYNLAVHEFKTALKDRTRRMLHILIKDIPAETVEQVVESGHADQLVAQAMITPDLDNVVADIEERHQGIVRLEQQILQLHEMMCDLNTLVDQQQATMDVISERIDRAESYTHDGLDKVRKAKQAQSTARKTKGCLIALLAVILGPVLGTQLAKRS